MTCTLCVLGAVNMDLVVQSPSFPVSGESLTGSSFETHPGGKGANRAVAAARLGAEVSLVGCVGDDSWGSEMRAVLAAEGISLGGLVTVAGQHTGTSLITVVPGGQTALINVPAANDRLAAAVVEEADERIREAQILLLHREIPEDAALRAVEVAARADTTVLLNAAPSGPVSPELLSRVQVLITKEDGARIMSGSDEDVSAQGLARRLEALGPELVVITRGRLGALSFNGQEVIQQDGFAVEAVDTTAAAAAFAAGYAVAKAEGQRGTEALRFACAAGSLATSKAGALASLPTREGVEALLGG